LQRLKNHHCRHQKRLAEVLFASAFRRSTCSLRGLGQAAGGFLAKPDPALLGYGDPAGECFARADRHLSASLAGLSCTAEQIVITSGAQQAISLCAQLLLQPGDGVAVENPGYRAAGHASPWRGPGQRRAGG
jgi:GntR family transcriptional regulator/MocR family aminotransferase